MEWRKRAYLFPMSPESIRHSPEISILIVCFNGREVVGGCLRSLRRVRDEADFEIILIDNASTDGSVELVQAEFPEVRVFASPQNLGFAGALNIGFRLACGGVLLALNPDTFVPRGTLRRMIDFFEENPRAGVAGAALTYADGEPQDSTFKFPSLPREFLNYLPEIKTILRPRQFLYGIRRLIFGYSSMEIPFRAPAVSGAAFAARCEVVKELNGFDEGFFVYHEERDFCRRVWDAGWEVWSLPQAQVIHLDATGTGYKRDRLPRMPLLAWRVGGMDRLWWKHRPGFAHRAWRMQSKCLLRIRIAFIFISLPVRGRKWRVAWERIREIRDCITLISQKPVAVVPRARGE